MSDTDIVADTEFLAALRKERELLFAHLTQILEEYERFQKRANDLSYKRDAVNRKLLLIDKLLAFEADEEKEF